MSIPFNKSPCVQDNHSEIVAANDIVADSVDLDRVDAIAVLYPAEVAAAIDVLDIAEAVDSPDLALVFAAILVLDPGKTEVAIAESAVVVHTVVVHTVIFCEFLSNIYIFLLKIKQKCIETKQKFTKTYSVQLLLVLN